MPTLQEWQQALTVPRYIRVESSPSLIQRIEQRLTRRDADRISLGKQLVPRKAVVSAVPTFAPQRDIPIVPQYLLQRLSVVTTPAVENLADICSWWAYFRYLWAFDIPVPGGVRPLRLSQAARDIDFHQKALLSDQMGIAFTAVLLGDYLDAPLAADVSVAMRDPMWPIELQFESSPDYLFFDNTQTNLFVVECKGTQTTPTASFDQICRGIEQVPSLLFTDGRTPPSLVVATLLSIDNTRVYVVDPPGDDELPSDHPEKPERLDERRWRVRDDKAFATATKLISEAKLLSYAGADSAASARLERARALPEQTGRPAERETEINQNEFGTFIGVRQAVAVKDRVNVEVFQALDNQVFQAILSEDSQRLTEELRDFRGRTAATSQAEPSQPLVISHDQNSLTVKTTGPDGTLLEVRVSTP
jgi:hypothetical protein